MRCSRELSRTIACHQRCLSTQTFHSAQPRSLAEYYAEYRRSVEHPLEYWGDVGTKHVEAGRGDSTAIIWEGDDPSDTRTISYLELERGVNQMANALKSMGVRAGDAVVIYMPSCPEATYTMLACARIGAVHAVVFAGFSAEALRSRISHVGAKVVVTVDSMRRNGRDFPLKDNVDEAILATPDVKNVLVLRRIEGSPLVRGRDVDLLDAMSRQRPWCPPEPFDAEHPLFVLYTSGSTGAPKGLLHTTGGYLAYAAFTHDRLFDHRRGDVHACVADIGWITGHTYIVYGPLMNGATTLMFEGVPNHPGPDRYWDMVDRHKITTFYTSPTALKTVAKYGDDPVKKYSLESLRVLGSVGEPLNAETWRWYYSVIGKGRCTIVDTYWQTETGGAIVAPLANVTPMKPGSASLPFFGIKCEIRDSSTGKPLEGAGSGTLTLTGHWPGISRTVLGDHQKYWKTYFADYEGIYSTGDGCIRDKEGYISITGRMDDVLKKAGHRIGTAEIESALLHSPAVAEAAVVGMPDEIKGEAIVVYVITKAHVDVSVVQKHLHEELRSKVRHYVGAIASPDHIVFTQWLPKTRSGKVMRRVLRKIASGDTSDLGDVSTLNDPQFLPALIQAANHEIRKKD